MKKALFLVMLLSCALFITFSTYAADSLQSVYGKPIIDGVITKGEGWENAEWIPIGIKGDNPTVNGRIKILNDETNLYCLVEAVDETPSSKIDFNWNTQMCIDAVEFWISFQRITDESAGFTEEGDIDFAIDYFGTIGYAAGDRLLMESIEYKVIFDGNKTSIYEIRIPCGGIDKLDENTVIGFDMQINDEADNVNNREGYVVLNWDGNYWSNPAYLGELRLASALPPAETSAEIIAAETSETDGDITPAPMTGDTFMFLLTALMCCIISVIVIFNVRKIRN